MINEIKNSLTSRQANRGFCGEVGLVLALLNALSTARVILSGNDDDIRMKPTTGIQCHTLLRKMARVLLCATLYSLQTRCDRP